MTKVFLVEDSPLVLGRIRELLASLPGAEVIGEAATSDAAIEGILQSRPDVVLLDFNLAYGSGFDVLRALHPRLPEIDFYMLSNFAAPAYRNLAAELGAKDYFDKTRDFGRVRELLAARASSATKH